MTHETKNASGTKVQTTAFSLYEADLARLNALTSAIGCSRSEAIRQCLACTSIVNIYRYLQAENPGLSFSDCVAQVFREWLVDHAPRLTMEDMFDGLRSDDSETRVRAGKLLSMSVGVGLRLSGEAEEDVLHTVGPDLSKLIGQAMAGDSSATDYLESILCNTPPKEKPKCAKGAKRARKSGGEEVCCGV